MKKSIFILAIVAAALVSCKRVTIEEQVSKLYEGASLNAGIQAQAEKAEAFEGDDLSDYYSYLLAKEANVKLKEIEEDDRFLMAKIRGKNKKDRNTILITAKADDRTACSVAIGVLKLFKESGIKPNHNVRLLIYQDSLENPRNTGEAYLIRMNLHHNDTLATHRFYIREASPIYQKIQEIIPQYLKPYGDYSLTDELYDGQRPYRNSDYDYNVCREELGKETATVATMIHLLN